VHREIEVLAVTDKPMKTGTEENDRVTVSTPEKSQNRNRDKTGEKKHEFGNI